MARALAAGPAGAHVVMAGDFNCIIDADDSSSPSGAAETTSAGAVALRGLLAGAGLADAWLTHRARSTAPDGRFAHFPARGCARRLDRAYVSPSLSSPTQLIHCRHMPLGGLPGDHCGVVLHLGTSGSAGPAAPPRWRLPLDLLKDVACRI